MNSAAPTATIAELHCCLWGRNTAPVALILNKSKGNQYMWVITVQQCGAVNHFWPGTNQNKKIHSQCKPESTVNEAPEEKNLLCFLPVILSWLVNLICIPEFHTERSVHEPSLCLSVSPHLHSNQPSDLPASCLPAAVIVTSRCCNGRHYND